MQNISSQNSAPRMEILLDTIRSLLYGLVLKLELPSLNCTLDGSLEMGLTLILGLSVLLSSAMEMAMVSLFMLAIDTQSKLIRRFISIIVSFVISGARIQLSDYFFEERTIGVLTKIDLMDKGTNAVDFPWIGVVNRFQADINKSVDMIAARCREREYFASSTDYKHLSHKMNSEHLGKMLSKVDHYRRLPMGQSWITLRMPEHDIQKWHKPEYKVYDKISKIILFGCDVILVQNFNKSYLSMELVSICNRVVSVSMIGGGFGENLSDVFDINHSRLQIVDEAVTPQSNVDSVAWMDSNTIDKEEEPSKIQPKKLQMPNKVKKKKYEIYEKPLSSDWKKYRAFVYAYTLRWQYYVVDGVSSFYQMLSHDTSDFFVNTFKSISFFSMSI
ncbi:hypothetical protein GIB67_031997 [Kingdonia uniflora]|uniref:Dynamin stalk domain-containing protein n=1 Tax=Kingdonia uniflora TaxID=39325 RepID=A0A7J7MWH2_9MAGN|nr:hypothetical protein GIB67_031997 [Kingdonia uniflora]